MFSKGMGMLKQTKLNELYVDTRWGTRSFELWHGDITKLNSTINLLLIAQHGDHPASSLYKSLKSELGISVPDLHETKVRAARRNVMRIICSIEWLRARVHRMLTPTALIWRDGSLLPDFNVVMINSSRMPR
jgi:hypothetical protein